MLVSSLAAVLVETPARGELPLLLVVLVLMEGVVSAVLMLLLLLLPVARLSLWTPRVLPLLLLAVLGCVHSIDSCAQPLLCSG